MILRGSSNTGFLSPGYHMFNAFPYALRKCKTHSRHNKPVLDIKERGPLVVAEGQNQRFQSFRDHPQHRPWGANAFDNAAC